MSSSSESVKSLEEVIPGQLKTKYALDFKLGIEIDAVKGLK
jgi:hypothetical protein